MSDQVHAFRWLADPAFRLAPPWLCEAKRRNQCRLDTINAPNLALVIPTADGLDYARVGDYVVRYANGRLGMMKAAEFERMYEAAGEEPDPVQDVASVIRHLLQVYDASDGPKLITLEDVAARMNAKGETTRATIYRLRVAAAA